MDFAGEKADMMNFDVNVIIDQVKGEVVKELKEIVLDAFDDVVAFSPTPQNNVGGFSEGSYVLSHRIALNSVDDSITEVDAPDQSADLEARAYAYAEVQKIIKDIDSTVVISNSIDYALDVEIGENWSRTPGYHTYEKATQAIMERVS